MSKVPRARGGSRRAVRSLAVTVVPLVVLAAAVYARVGSLGFVFDDSYITGSEHIRRGLTLRGLHWAFTSPFYGNWAPLLTLSEMLEAELIGLHPRSQHLANLLLHVLNTLLLLGVLVRMTGDRWRSTAVAAFFAVHPFHVESVVFGRADLLSTLFGLLALSAYTRCAGRWSPGRYLAVTVWFALSLAGKQMLVTFPFLLLLLDAWPLNRPAGRHLRWEKLPLLALSAVAGAMVYFARLDAGAMDMVGRYPFTVRLENAAASYLEYLRKTFWPSEFAVLYPHPGAALAAWKPALGAAVLTTASALAVLLRRKAPAFAVGWFWFVGTLVPVIGLVQVGEQAMADRYTYVPLIGLFVAAAWGIPAGSRGWRRGALATAVAAGVAVLSLISARQLTHWKDNRSLYARAVAVAPENWMMQANLGADLKAAGELPEAIDHFRAAARLRPDLAEVRYNLGAALLQAGRLEEAAAELRETRRLNPHLPWTDYHLGATLLRLGRVTEALPSLAAAVRTHPGDANLRVMLGDARIRSGEPRLAAEDYRAALQLDPGNRLARSRLAALPP